MSRSFRHSPYIGYLGDSEKTDKRIWHQRFRSRVRTAMASGRNIPLAKEVSDVWDMAKDGKMRFNSRKHPEFLRR